VGESRGVALLAASVAPRGPLLVRFNIGRTDRPVHLPRFHVLPPCCSRAGRRRARLHVPATRPSAVGALAVLGFVALAIAATGPRAQHSPAMERGAEPLRSLPPPPSPS